MDSPLRPPFVDDLPQTRRALEYALHHHEGQRRDWDAAPFILHPLEVGALLRNLGHEDEVVAAALLHDAVENTDATLADLREHFGDHVCALVRAVTDDESIEDYDEQKAKLRAQVAAATPEAQAIYAADKVTKARELRATIARDPSAAEDAAIRRRLAHYDASLEMLRERLPDHVLVRQLQFELWALQALPPATG